MRKHRKKIPPPEKVNTKPIRKSEPIVSECQCCRQLDEITNNSGLCPSCYELKNKIKNAKEKWKPNLELIESIGGRKWMKK